MTSHATQAVRVAQHITSHHHPPFLPSSVWRGGIKASLRRSSLDNRRRRTTTACCFATLWKHFTVLNQLNETDNDETMIERRTNERTPTQTQSNSTQLNGRRPSTVVLSKCIEYFCTSVRTFGTLITGIDTPFVRWVARPHSPAPTHSRSLSHSTKSSESLTLTD